MALLDDVGTILAGAGVGTVKTSGNTPAWPIYCAGVYPALQDPAIFVFSSPAAGGIIRQMGATSAASVVYVRPRFLVSVRHTDPRQALAKAQACFDALDWYTGTPAGGVFYSLIEALDDEANVLSQKDGQQRAMAQVNFQATKVRG